MTRGAGRGVGSRSERADRVDARSTDHRSSTCPFNRVITATIECDVADGGALIGRSAENPRVDRVDVDHRS